MKGLPRLLARLVLVFAAIMLGGVMLALAMPSADQNPNFSTLFSIWGIFCGAAGAPWIMSRADE